MEAINQGVTVVSHVEENIIGEVGEEFTTYDNPLDEQPPMADIAFHFLMEGHFGSSNLVVDHLCDDTEGIEYHLNAPFWITSLGQAIFEFGTTRPSFFNPPSNEETYRRLQPTMDHLHNFQENISNIIASPLPDQEPVSALLPCL